MMMTPDKATGSPSYAQATVPPPGAPQSTPIPVTLQWNVNPVPSGPNGYPGPLMMNAASPALQIISPNGVHQWNVQCPPPGYVTSAILPQSPQLGVFHQTFLKGKPFDLGIVLIVVSILQIVLGIALAFLISAFTIYSGIPFWGSTFYIIAGSLSISASKNPNICMVKGALALSIISSIASMIGIILNILDFLFARRCYNYYCSSSADGFIILCFLLIMNLLVFCVSVSLSVFGCRAAEKASSSSAPPMIVIQNEAVPSMLPSAYPTQSFQVPNVPPPPYVLQQ